MIQSANREHKNHLRADRIHFSGDPMKERNAARVIILIEQMLMAEVIERKLLRLNLVHGRAGVGDCTDFVGIVFFPICGPSFTAYSRTPFRFSETSFPKISLRINSSPTSPPKRPGEWPLQVQSNISLRVSHGSS